MEYINEKISNVFLILKTCVFLLWLPVFKDVDKSELLLIPNKINPTCLKNFYKSITYEVLLVTIVKGDQKAPFSIATTLRCRGECYSFPWIAPLYPRYIPYIAEC